MSTVKGMSGELPKRKGKKKKQTTVNLITFKINVPVPLRTSN